MGTIEFRDPKLERLVGLTAADRKWMDNIVHDVNESWNDADPTKGPTLQLAHFLQDIVEPLMTTS